MTAEEIGQLLALCASFDARTVDEVDILAWGEALAGELSFKNARRNVIAYYRRHREPIMPSDILNPELDDGFWER